MYPTNEWSQLKSVIVGVADHAQVPDIDISVRTVNYANEISVDHIETGPYPQIVIDQANQDLETLCKFLKQQGVTVQRPLRNTTEYYNYCPRDVVFAHKKLALATPMPIRARRNNYKSLEHCFEDLVVAQRHYDQSYYNLNCVGDPDTLALHETVPMFDAANILRANDDLLYLVSNSANSRGADLLQEMVGSETRVHKLNGVYSYMHIDSTVAFLREGLMLLNPSRIPDKSVLPAPFDSWDAIYAPEPVEIGYYPNYCNASKWVSINLFSINENLVVLEQHQHNLRQELEKHRIECAMLPMRHSRTLAGVFHCVTLDVERNETA
jgi:N-dimethylarginine dimethylaminohydrolase